MVTKASLQPVRFWASVFGPVFSGLITVFAHTKAHFADGDAIIGNREIIFISEMSRMAWVEVNKGSDILPPAVIVDRIGIMGGIQKELFDAEFRKIGFHSEKRVQEGKHIMPGSPFQERENREVTEGIGSHIHVEVVTEEITFPVGIPAPVAVRL